MIRLPQFALTARADGTLTGDGSAANPYQIGTADDWETFAAWINTGTHADGYYKLTADIGTESDPITAAVGTVTGDQQGVAFAGNFDGGGHGIYVSITNTSDQGTALFRYISGATIKNMKVMGMVSGTMHCAGLVGFASGTNTISNCEVATEVTCGRGPNRVAV